MNSQDWDSTGGGQILCAARILSVGTSVGRRDNRSIGIIPSSTFYRPVARIFAAGCWKSETIDIPGNSVRRRSRCRRSSIFTPTLPFRGYLQGEDPAICADLTKADHIPSDSFDCIILTFTLQFIFDVRAAIRTVARILNPGGVALLVFPGITQISRYDMDNWGEFWRFTSLSARRLFEEVFRPDDVTVTTYGNVLAATASLQGLISSELRREELDHWDRDYELVIGLRAVKR